MGLYATARMANPGRAMWEARCSQQVLAVTAQAVRTANEGCIFANRHYRRQRQKRKGGSLTAFPEKCKSDEMLSDQ